MAKVTIGFRTDPEIKNELLEKAKDLGISLSDYCENLIVIRRNNVNDNGFRKPVLTESDMDIIEEVLADQLHSFFKGHRPDNLLDEWEETDKDELQEEENTREEEDDIPTYENLIGLLELPEKQASNLSDYILKSAEVLEVEEEEVIAKMLAYAYEELAPKKGGVFNRGIGQVSSDNAFAELWW